MLGARGPRPTTVLGTAVNLAQEWRQGRLPAESGSGEGLALLVQPRQGRWIIRAANHSEASHVFSVREDAVRRAQELGIERNVPVFVFGPGGTLIERYAAPSTPRTAPARTLIARPAPRPEPRPAAPVAAPVALMPLPPVPVAQVPAPTLEAAVESVVEALGEDLGTATSEPVVETPSVRLVKDGRRWLVVAPDGRREAFPTRKKAVKVASDLALKLSVQLELD
jgi:hypothetical protein